MLLFRSTKHTVVQLTYMLNICVGIIACWGCKLLHVIDRCHVRVHLDVKGSATVWKNVMLL